MDIVTACMIADGSIEAEDEDQLFEAYQLLVTSRVIQHLQGSLQRAAASLIEAGYVSPPDLSADHNGSVREYA